MSVVRAEGAAARFVRREPFDEREQVARKGPFANRDVHPERNALAKLFARRAFVVRQDALGRVGLKPRARQERRMAVDGFAAEARAGSLAVGLFIFADEARNVHHFAEPKDLGALQERLGFVRIDRRARILKGERRDARRHHDLDRKWQRPAGFDQALHGPSSRRRSPSRAGRR